ncbi:MAG: anti-sigma factor antagonist [bacterium]|nr:MAG: anti-sigma factor antagonist [bacterium]
MEAAKRENNGITIIDFIGNIKSPDDLKILSQAIDEEIEKQRKTILLDFKDVSFINSSGLGRLILAVKKISDNDGTLSIMNLTEDLEELFTFTKLKEKIPVYKNEEEAINNLQS